jgi:hypothetical protein
MRLVVEKELLDNIGLVAEAENEVFVLPPIGIIGFGILSE